VRLEYLFRDWYEPGPARTKWHATVAIVGRTDDGGFAAAFMGSADARHAVTNLQLLERERGAGSGRTLRGMRRAFDDVRRGEVARLGGGVDAAFAPLEAACAGRWDEARDPAVCVPRAGVRLADLLAGAVDAALEDDRFAPVHVSGHSLGGALALQLALLAARRTARVYATTFGEPPYGDAAFFAAQKRTFPDLVRRYDRRVAVTAAPACRADIVPETTRLAGGGGHFAAPHYACASDPPRNVLAAHAMAGYFRAARDAARDAFGLGFAYRGPGFWGSDTSDDPLLVAAAQAADAKATRDRERAERRARPRPSPRAFLRRLRTRWGEPRGAPGAGAGTGA
jgi:pimeloyl-ACP methyl ester carboxylesterase